MKGRATMAEPKNGSDIMFGAVPPDHIGHLTGTRPAVMAQMGTSIPVGPASDPDRHGHMARPLSSINNPTYEEIFHTCNTIVVLVDLPGTKGRAL